jgi:hypothetical protein
MQIHEKTTIMKTVFAAVNQRKVSTMAIKVTASNLMWSQSIPLESKTCIRLNWHGLERRCYGFIWCCLFDDSGDLSGSHLSYPGRAGLERRFTIVQKQYHA